MGTQHIALPITASVYHLVAHIVSFLILTRGNLEALIRLIITSTITHLKRNAVVVLILYWYMLRVEPRLPWLAWKELAWKELAWKEFGWKGLEWKECLKESTI